jgi:type II secretory pathway pseudopilin PulG
MEKTRNPRPSRRAGMTLMEIVIAMGVLAIALLGLVAGIMTAQRTNEASRELTIAMNAAREKEEEMRSRTFAEIYALYNSNPADDPGGPGTAPGSTFAVQGLVPVAGATACGQIVFPEGPGGFLAEAVVDAKLGMPRDLNGDGDIDADDRSSDYGMLPMRIAIRWRGIYGPGEFEINTILYEK